MSTPIDIFDPELYRLGVPHDRYTQLRRSAPISFQQEADGPGYWAVMRHADVVYASRKPRIFSSALGGINIPDAAEEDLDIARMILINMDPPQHARYRRLVASGFTPRTTRRMEGAVRAAVDTVLDRVAEQERVDFVTAIAAQLPLFIIADLIGWPEADRALMFDWSDRVARIDYTPEDARVAAMEFWNYCAELIESLPPGDTADDLLHVLLAAQIDGDQLDMMEVVNFLLLLAIGGNETTRNCISGGFLALHEFPDQHALLRNDPQGLSAGAVEEMLRWSSPITAFRRTTTQDTTLGEQAIKAGEKVVLYYASANRDEAVFAAPQQLDIRRDPNPHLAFGSGQHFCLGATLARLEIRILFEELMRRFPDMTPEGSVERLPSNYVNSIVGFTVRTR